MPTSSIDAVLRQKLTPEQYQAAVDPAKEVLTLACAGSGKSRTLAYRIARLLAEGEDPKSIVAFTFTEKAAEAIKLRVAKALEAAGLQPTAVGAMYLGTIHAFCQLKLGEMDATYRQFDVLDENRLKLFLISRYPQLRLDQLRLRAANRSFFRTIKEVADAWKTMNDEVVSLADVQAQDRSLGEVLGALQDRLRQDEYIDFSLMIRTVADALRASEASAERAVAKLKHLMVDEYQDINPAQEVLIQELHKRSSTLFVVGDDDQAIYAWRGADVSNIIDFGNRYPACSRYTLAKNFRSTKAIVAAADGFVAGVLGAMRISKLPQADDPSGPRHFGNHWFPDRQSEAAWVADRIAALLGTAYLESDSTVRGLTPGDFAVLMRSTRQPESDGTPRHVAFTAALATRNITFSLESGGGVFDRNQVAVLRDTFLLLRSGSPTREQAQSHFDTLVSPVFPNADFNEFAQVLSEWGRRIHEPIDITRRRVYPQQLVHDLLEAFGLGRTNFEPVVMRDIGIFSRIIQDVEAVYVSIDSARRFQDICNFLENVADSGYDTSTDDVLRRPDAVTVATVHKVKGLEFPVVFVVDVEGERFPGRRRSYEGWLPPAVIQNALNRGAYQGTPEEEARLFYTAITRAERFFYVSGAENLPGGRKRRKPSQFTLRLDHPEITADPAQLPPGLTQSARVPRIDEAVIPTSFSEIRYYLSCPRNYQFRKSFGFSPPIPEMFGFGMTVHTAVGKLHETFPSTVPSGREAEDLAKDVFHLKHMPPSRDPVNRPGGYERAKESAGQILRTYAESYREDFARNRQVEVRFEIPVEQAVITGTIDLLLKLDPEDRILDARVIDFKAMEGGRDPETNEELQWTELALQVQLYARAANDVLGENARTGAVHLLKDNQRVDVPVGDEAVRSAVENVEWAVNRILAGDFPMRPHPKKCENCDFRLLCAKESQSFSSATQPPPIQIPRPPRQQLARAFSEFAPVP
ncbi:MAG: ATP-dependent helicase [Verrucomicrobia bacterium]|nr:ATP-dependent helicase [Verrucomicrobiota bacterium]